MKNILLTRIVKTVVDAFSKEVTECSMHIMGSV